MIEHSFVPDTILIASYLIFRMMLCSRYCYLHFKGDLNWKFQEHANNLLPLQSLQFKIWDLILCVSYPKAWEEIPTAYLIEQERDSILSRGKCFCKVLELWQNWGYIPGYKSRGKKETEKSGAMELGTWQQKEWLWDGENHLKMNIHSITRTLSWFQIALWNHQCALNKNRVNSEF